MDKIIDSTGGIILDRSFEAIRPLGLVVSYGEAAGWPFCNLSERLVRKSLAFTRMHLGHVDHKSEVWKRGQRDLPIGSGRYPKGALEGVFPMDQVHAMYEKLESRQVSGKLLLQIG